MRKYLSVLGLIARNSFYRVLTAVFTGAVVQFALFYLAAGRSGIVYTPENILGLSYVPVVSIFVLIAVYIFICLTGTHFGSKSGYTINRLLISEKEFFMIQTVYNSLVFLFVWLFEAAVATVCCLYCLYNAPENTVHAQSIFLAFYRSAYLHGLIPLEAWHVWLRNIFIAVALGFACSQFSYKQRRGKFSLISLAVPVLVCSFFAVESDDWANSVVVIIGSVLVILSRLIEKKLKEESK